MMLYHGCSKVVVRLSLDADSIVCPETTGPMQMGMWHQGEV